MDFIFLYFLRRGMLRLKRGGFLIFSFSFVHVFQFFSFSCF